MQKHNLCNLAMAFQQLSTIFITFAFLIYPPLVSAQAKRHASDFNHMSTGFPLNGVHTGVECETCHVGGIFKGTPTACSGCHSPGRKVVATFKSANHIITNAPCETCHTNSVSFLGARFNHIGVQPKACTTCHNGSMGPGKPPGHVVTVSSCDTCHRSSSWIPAGFDHMSAATPVLGRCNQCHDGVQAVGKYPLHIATPSPSCDTVGCHSPTNYVTFAGLKYNHVLAIPGQCGTCHSGQTAGAPTQTPVHIPYTGLGCNNCHVTPPAATAFNSPLPTMNHGAVAGLACSRCHSGNYISQVGSLGLGAQGKASKVNHVSTSSECNVCHHSYTDFAGATMDHGAVTPPVMNRCNDCHTGANGGKVKTAGVHIPTTNTCQSCHSTTIFTSFQGISATMNHAVETGACTTCHITLYSSQGSKYGGAKTMTSISNHIPVTNTDCKNCHIGFTSFTAPLSSNATQHTLGMSITCKNCHSANLYLGVRGIQPLTHYEKYAGQTDCTASACHKPTGGTEADTNYTNWKN